MVVRMRHTRAHTKNRRSHHALEGERFSKCPNCGQAFVPHRVCPHCGMYRGRQVVDVVGITQRKALRRKEKMKELGKDPNPKEEKGKEKQLDAETLSKK